MEGEAEALAMEVLRGRVIGMHEAGGSKTEIVERLGLDSEVVCEWIDRWERKSEAEALRERPRSGRRPRYYTRTRRQCAHELTDAISRPGRSRSRSRRQTQQPPP